MQLFPALVTAPFGRSHWVFQRTDGAMMVVVLVLAAPLQLGLCPLLLGWQVGLVWLALLPLGLLSGKVLRFRDGTVTAWRMFFGLPLPFGHRLGGPLLVEIGDREVDWATSIPELAVVGDRGVIALAVQPGHEVPLERALREAVGRSAAPCCS